MLRRRTAQSSIEYIVIVGALAVMVFFAFTAMGGKKPSPPPEKTRTEQRAPAAPAPDAPAQPRDDAPAAGDY